MSRTMKYSIVAICLVVSLAAIMVACSGGGSAAPAHGSVYRAYVADSSGQAIKGYVIDRTTGALVSTGSTGTTPLGTWPLQVVADLSGRFVYTANTSDNTVSAFSINAVTVALTSAGTSTTGGLTVFVNTDPLSRFLYAVSWNSSEGVAAFTINPSNGALTKTDCGGGAGCSGMNFAVGSVPYSNTAFDAAGKYAYLTLQGEGAVARFAIDQTTGALSSKITATAGASPGYVVIDPTGKFAYVANSGGDDVSAYTVSASTGTLSQIDCGGGAGCNGKNFSVGAGAFPSGLATDLAGKFLYVANANNNTVSAFTINGATGALTPVAGSPYTIGAGANGCISVATDPSGKFLYATNYMNNYVAGFTINSATGELSAMAGNPLATGLQAYFISTTITSY